MNPNYIYIYLMEYFLLVAAFRISHIGHDVWEFCKGQVLREEKYEPDWDFALRSPRKAFFSISKGSWLTLSEDERVSNHRNETHSMWVPCFPFSGGEPASLPPRDCHCWTLLIFYIETAFTKLTRHDFEVSTLCPETSGSRNLVMYDIVA